MTRLAPILALLLAVAACDNKAAKTTFNGPTQIAMLKVDGMTCPSCASGITDILKAKPGVKEVTVNNATKTARVEYWPEAIQPQALADTLSESSEFKATVSN